MEENVDFTVECYRHSGRFGWLVPFAVPLVALAALILGFVYAYAIVYIPIVGYLSFILTAGYGIILGLVIAYLLYQFKTRNIWIARLFGVGGAFIGIYFVWATFLFVFINRFDEEPIGFLPCLNPLLIVGGMFAIAEEGWYSIGSFQPAGFVLWFMWLIEALIIMVLIYIMAGTKIADAVFCEVCNKWTAERKGVASFVLASERDIFEQFAQCDFSFLQEMVPAKTNAPVFFRIDSSICHDCKELHALSLVSVTTTINDKGEPETKEEPIIQHLLVDEAHYKELLEQKKAIGGRLQSDVSQS